MFDKSINYVILLNLLGLEGDKSGFCVIKKILNFL